jgi:hypothetical protein
MHRTTRLITSVIAVCVLCTGVISTGTCQGIDSYALVHPFGLATATTTRQFAMGGPVSCVWDRGFANPAFAPMQQAPNASLRLSSTDFDRGPDLVSTHLHVVYPLRENVSGLQLSLFSLHSNSGMTMTPGVGPTVVELSEEDISIQYGHRLGPRLTGGIGLSPMSEIEFASGVPGGPMLLQAKSESDIGARLGLAYEWAPGDYLGLVYDYYQETVQGTGAAVGGAARRVFHTDLLAVGASRRVAPDWLVVAEYQHGSSFDGPTDNSISGWHLGAEFSPSPKYAVRAGLNDERPSFGVGYMDSRWQVDYTYMSRWNDDIAASVFGASDTHQLQLIGSW